MSLKQQSFLNALFSEEIDGNVIKALAKAKVSRKTAHRWACKCPAFMEILSSQLEGYRKLMIEPGFWTALRKAVADGQPNALKIYFTLSRLPMSMSPGQAGQFHPTKRQELLKDLTDDELRDELQKEIQKEAKAEEIEIPKVLG